MTCPSSREHFTIEVRERICEGVASLVSACCRGRVNVDVVLDQELFEHLTSRSQEIAVAALAPELERAFRGTFRDGTIRHCRLDVGRNDDLQIALDTLREADEIRRRADSPKLRV